MYQPTCFGYYPRIFLKLGLVLALAMTVGMRSASADIIYFDLSVSNLSSSYTGAYAQVEVNLTDSTHATITFTSLSNSTYEYLFTGGSSVDVNVNATSWTLSSLSGTDPFAAAFHPPTYSNAGSANVAGYGTFNQTIDSSGSSLGEASNEIQFTLKDTSGTWSSASNVLTPKNDGALAAAHIGAYPYTTELFNFDTIGFAAANNGSPPPVETPAPSSAVLLGVGGLCLGGFALRSRRRPVAAA